jgi:outer membrane protein assembly factor BamB
MKYFKQLFLAFFIILSSTTTVHAFSVQQTGIVSVKTPIDTKKSGAAWLRSFSSESISYNSVPVILDEKIYIVNANILYELNKQGNILRQTTLSACMNSVCDLVYENGYLYIPLDGGIMQCIRCSDMKIIWTSEAFTGQSLSTVTYYQGYLYAGTTRSPAGNTSGTFYCLDASSGRTVWTYENESAPGGYYWSGSAVFGNALYFAGDNGILVSHSLTGSEVYSQWTLSKTAKIRAGIVCDTENGVLYTTSNDGMVYRIHVSTDGIILSVQSSEIVPGSKSANCTSTPVIWNNRLYVGSLADTYGYLTVMDSLTLKPYYHVSTGQYKEVKSSPLVSTGYSSDTNPAVYVYFTCNALPGSIFMIKDNPSASMASVQTLYTPEKKQYCISSIFAGADGTLYYSNDSGNLFAVQELLAETENPSSAKNITTIKKPSALKWKYKNKNWVFTFRKNAKNTQTIIYVRYNKGKWKKAKTTSASKCKIKLAEKKKIDIRLKNRKKNTAKKWIYSAYTKTYHIR